jgi:hypothetical protein
MQAWESPHKSNFDVIPAQAGFSTAELVIHFALVSAAQDQDGFPLDQLRC